MSNHNFNQGQPSYTPDDDVDLNECNFARNKREGCGAVFWLVMAVGLFITTIGVWIYKSL